MPDIAMCPSEECPLRVDCERNEASGTTPTPGWQNYIGFSWRQVRGEAFVLCDGFLPTLACEAAGRAEMLRARMEREGGRDAQG